MKTDIATIRAIHQFLKRPDCIVFVGSGASTWSGLPTWRALLGELAHFLDTEGHSSELVRREVKNGDLLQAASCKLRRQQADTRLLWHVHPRGSSSGQLDSPRVALGNRRTWADELHYN